MTIRRILPIAAVLVLSAGGRAAAQPQTFAVSGFAIEQSVTVPGTPEEAFDAITGDVSGWWDHHYSETPLRLYIEPVPADASARCSTPPGTARGTRR